MGLKYCIATGTLNDTTFFPHGCRLWKAASLPAIALNPGPRLMSFSQISKRAQKGLSSLNCRKTIKQRLCPPGGISSLTDRHQNNSSLRVKAPIDSEECGPVPALPASPPGLSCPHTLFIFLLEKWESDPEESRCVFPKANPMR